MKHLSRFVSYLKLPKYHIVNCIIKLYKNWIHGIRLHADSTLVGGTSQLLSSIRFPALCEQILTPDFC